MRSLLLISLLLFGCTTNAAPPPTGEEVLSALLKNGAIRLKDEPLCQMTTASIGLNDITLADHLSVVLSTSYETNNITTISSKCEKSKHDNKGATIDIWDCSLQINEKDTSGEYISGSTIAFGITLKEKKLVAGSLRCF